MADTNKKNSSEVILLKSESCAAIKISTQEICSRLHGPVLFNIH